MLMWGVPVPNNNASGRALRERIFNISKNLLEKSTWRSEPDVVLDFGEAGLVVIEAKLFSGSQAGELWWMAEVP